MADDYAPVRLGTLLLLACAAAGVLLACAILPQAVALIWTIWTL